MNESSLHPCCSARGRKGPKKPDDLYAKSDGPKKYGQSLKEERPIIEMARITERGQAPREHPARR